MKLRRVAQVGGLVEAMLVAATIVSACDRSDARQQDAAATPDALPNDDGAGSVVDAMAGDDADGDGDAADAATDSGRPQGDALASEDTLQANFDEMLATLVEGKTFSWLPDGSLQADGTKALCANSLGSISWSEECDTFCLNRWIVDCAEMKPVGMCANDQQCVGNACQTAPPCQPGTYSCFYEDATCTVAVGIGICKGDGKPIEYKVFTECEPCAKYCPSAGASPP